MVIEDYTDISRFAPSANHTCGPLLVIPTESPGVTPGDSYG